MISAAFARRARRRPTGTSLTDGFDRTDNPTSLGSTPGGVPWQILRNGPWGIASGRAKYMGGAGGAQSVAAVPIGSLDHWAEAQLVANDNGSGVAVRISDADHFYFAQTGSGSWILYTAPTYNVLASGAFSLGDTCRLAVVGTTLTVSRNGVPVATVTDSTFTTGTMVGLRADTSATIFDNFAASSL